jgi:hypothetical protein
MVEQRLAQQVLQQILPVAQQLQFMPQTALVLEETEVHLHPSLPLTRIGGTALQVCNAVLREFATSKRMIATKHSQALATAFLVRITTLEPTHHATPLEALHVLETLGVALQQHCLYVIATITQTLQARTIMVVATALELAMLLPTPPQIAPHAVPLRVRINK